VSYEAKHNVKQIIPEELSNALLKIDMRVYKADSHVRAQNAIRGINRQLHIMKQAMQIPMSNSREHNRCPEMNIH